MKSSSASNWCVRLFATVVCSACYACLAAPASGPLRVHPTNTRYFTDGTKYSDGSLKAVYLTGSHTWGNLVYQPTSGGAFSVELPADTYRFEWFNPRKGVVASHGNIQSSGGAQAFTAPFEGDAVLYLKAQTNRQEK